MDGFFAVRVVAHEVGIAVASPAVIGARAAERFQARFAHGHLLGSSRNAVEEYVFRCRSVARVARPQVNTGFVYDARRHCVRLTNQNIFLPVSSPTFKKHFPLPGAEAFLELSEVLFFLHVAPGETQASEAVFFRTIEHTGILHACEDTGACQPGAVGELHGF